MKSNAKQILVIANIRDASPRIPAIFKPLIDAGWEITIVTGPVAGCSILKVPECENLISKISLLETDAYEDVYEPIRTVFKFTGLSTKKQKRFT